MKNDDFFKSLKENLENRPEPTFQEGAWKAMEKQLVESKEEENTTAWTGKWWLPLLLLLLLGMAGSNFWFYNQLQTLKNNSLSIQTDTVYKSQVIFQRDTIYQTRVIKEIVRIEKNTSQNFDNQNAPNNQNLANLSTTENPFEVNGAAIQKEIADLMESFGQLAAIPLLDLTKENPLIISDLSNKNTSENTGLIKDKSTDLVANSPMLSFDKLPNLETKLITWNPIIPDLFIDIPYVKKQKTLRQRVYEMRPQTFRLALNGGFANTNNKELDNLGGYIFGLNASIGFSPNIRLWSEAAFLQVKYSSSKIAPELGIPNIAPPQDNFEFQKAEVTQPTYQFGLGFQYLFNARNKFKPYLGVGYGMVALVPYEVTYDYTDPSTDIDLTLEQTVKQNDLLKGQILLKAGLEYKFTKRWAWQLEGMYRKGNENIGLSAPNVWSARSGLAFKF